MIDNTHAHELNGTCPEAHLIETAFILALLFKGYSYEELQSDLEYHICQSRKYFGLEAYNHEWQKDQLNTMLKGYYDWLNNRE